MQIYNYQFKPKLLPTVLTVLALFLFVNLGQWQSGKAKMKQAKQDLYDQRSKESPYRIGGSVIDIETARYSPVIARGSYEPEFQILLDNQVYKGQAGYDVITPLHITGSNMRVLINRGWVPVGDRSVLPLIETPVGEVELRGIAQEPPSKFFELAAAPAPAAGKWLPVWQNLDMGKYAKAVSFPLHKIIVQLDPADAAGGFAREWPKPDLKIDMNRGYAMQWYFMSIALVIIYLVLNLKKISSQDQQNAK